ncbi:amino-acid N-acetyltransferase [Thiohalophilus thiocyanatoxydans]|uniref:Amino-acid acetyltransferase n=1 Tax=Thiohalophilus thiocyanatoxydans TaxID=381308 RepID=A0A4R8IQJ7_9GAMM|nr:amino-acid N-acetyltransferase [Thiohalophilus thiocyanatoxydans]TDX99362.1 N-acetylglutamate synthase [Thiohalophilus thiocyanatoxydans]
MAPKAPPTDTDFVRWFRDSSPYINAFRGKVFVIAFGGEMLTDAQFAPLVHDLALLNSLGVKLVLVHGTRPQIETCLTGRDAELVYVNGLRVTDSGALDCVKEAAGSVRVDIEALLSMGLANSPMAGARIRLVSGNFVTAQPLGVREGVDYGHTGEVRRIDRDAIAGHLDNGDLVLLSPIGYSPTGEIFNLSAEDVATAAASQLQADKLILLIDDKGITDNRKRLLRELTPDKAEALLQSNNKLNTEQQQALRSAVHACRHDVNRAHIINRHIDGALLLELFTRDGCGTLLSNDPYEDLRRASIDDIGGILELIKPLEADDILVRRSRERLETEIEHFTVVERDGTIIGCAALYPFIDEQVGELACLAVHPDYRDQGRGDALLQYLEKTGRQLGIRQMLVLTTRTAHWFRERGFKPGELKSLPVKRQQLYNYQRQSKVFIKDLD